MEENKNVEVLEETKANTPKKKSPVGLIILVIILMVGCLVGGYFINESGILGSKKDEKEEKGSDKEKKEEKKEPVVTNYAVTDEKVAKLIDRLLVRGSGVGNNCNVVEFYTNDKKVVANDIPNLMAYHIGEADFFNKKDSFSLDDINTAIQSKLGKDYKFDPTKINYKGETCPQYSYDDSTKTYSKQETACGWTCGPSTTYKVIKAVDTDGVLELDTKVIFSSAYNSNIENGYYSEYGLKNKIGTFEDQLENLYDKGSNYKFTFKLEDGNYVFVSSEPLK